MILATDVYYYEDATATSAGVVFNNWRNVKPAFEFTTKVDNVAPYEPGSFYKRELPCLRALLVEIARAGVPIDLIIVDGFVTLGEDQHAGLGQHLYEMLGCTVPVVGVAKTGFHGTPAECEVFRGKSNKPLFVTSAGIGLAQAKEAVQSMHGPHRLPSLLTRVDQLCRGINASPTSSYTL